MTSLVPGRNPGQNRNDLTDAAQREETTVLLLSDPVDATR
jgi:hypothetical protein